MCSGSLCSKLRAGVWVLGSELWCLCLAALTQLSRSRNPSAMRRVGLLSRCALATGCVVVGVLPALAEPYIGMREGLPCAACHVNVTGGGMRTDLVRTHARDVLRYPNFFGEFSNPPDYFTGEINKYVAIGSDLRANYMAVFQDEPVNGQVPNNEVIRGRLESNDFDVSEFVMYGQVRLIPDKLFVYVDQRFLPSIDTREAFVFLHGIFPYEGFVKAGRFFLPYGLQLQDDGAFIRGGTNGSANTGFSFNNQQAGLELGAMPGPMTLVASVTDGPPGDTDVQVTATAYGMFTDVPVVRSVMLGGSVSRVAPPGTDYVVFGFFGGTNLERLSLLAEVDFLSTKNPMTNGEYVGQFISYTEVNYLFFDWLNFKVAVNYADDDGNLSEHTDDAENLVLFGFEPFWNRFLQTRLFYSISNGVQSQPTHNQNVLCVEIHAFF